MSQSMSELVSDTTVKQSDNTGRRSRLREFQAQLLDRMQVARSGLDTRSNQLGLLIGADRWLLNLQQAGEIVPVGTISPVPLTRDWFLGITNIRGNLVTVIDFASYRGLPPTVQDKDARVVAFAPGLAFNCALLVSRVMGLRNVGEMELRQSDTDKVDEAWARKCYVDADENVWTELDLSVVMQEPRFLNVGL
jgi:twitching motility protein PilI